MRLISVAISITLLATAGCNGGSTAVISGTPSDTLIETPIEPSGEQETIGVIGGTTGGIMAMYSGATFVSLNPLESGAVSFTNDTVNWTQDGVTALGSYDNNGDTNLVATFTDREVNFSADGSNIIWDANNYRRAARFQFDSQTSLATYLDTSEYNSIEELEGGEGLNGVATTNTWSMRFAGDEVQWATRDTIAIGTFSYIDGSSFNVNFGNSSVMVVVLENHQIVIRGDIYEKLPSTEFDSQESLIEFLDGASYESVELRSMGQNGDGITSLGNWKINFSNDSFTWFYEDVAEAGTVNYLDSNTFTANLNDREYAIQVEGDDIIWDNTRYMRTN